MKEKHNININRENMHIKERAHRLQLGNKHEFLHLKTGIRLCTFIKTGQNYIYATSFIGFNPFPLCIGYIYNVLDPRGRPRNRINNQLQP